MKIVPKNIVHICVTLFTPWRFGKTYIEIHDNKIEFSRYYCFDGKNLELNHETINIDEICEIGFPSDLCIKTQEKSSSNKYGTYKSQEIIFKTNLCVYSLNARPYTKKQIETIIKILKEKNSHISCGKNLKDLLK